MAVQWTLTYDSLASFRAHLEEHAQRGVIFLPGTLGHEPTAFERIALQVQAGTVHYELEAELIQVLPNAGIVVRLLDLAGLDKHAEDASSPARAPGSQSSPDEEPHDDAPEPQEPALGDELAPPSADRLPSGPAVPAGSSVISWPIEKLQAEWDTLSLPDKIRVARHGKRAARALVLRGPDRTLLAHVLSNPSVGAEEVAVLAASPLLDPSLLRRIAANRDWLRASEVTRNLICNPKLPLPEVERLLRHLSQEELQRLAKSGRLRASVRAAIVKRAGGSK